MAIAENNDTIYQDLIHHDISRCNDEYGSRCNGTN